MNQIQKIIHYFFHHSFSDDIIEKVHRRLLASSNENEKEKALKDIWNESASPLLASEETLRAFTKVEQRITEKTTRRRSFSRLPGWLRIAAIWLLPVFLLCSSFYFYTQTKKIKDTVATLSFVEHYIPEGKREQIDLPDGSKVWLNSGTLLVYPSAFIGNKRQVYLAGEGYFEIKRNTDCPFTVNTKILSVNVLGTKFNLSAYPEAEQTTTTLEEGDVEVKLLSGFKPDQSFRLRPNEQLVVQAANGKAVKQTVVAPHYSEWKDGGLLFANSSFHDITKTLERVYNIRIHLLSSTFYGDHLTIHFNKGESLERIMILIKEMIPGLEYKIEKNELYIW